MYCITNIQWHNPTSMPSLNRSNFQDSVFLFSIEILQWSSDIASYYWQGHESPKIRTLASVIGQSWWIFLPLFWLFPAGCSGDGKEKRHFSWRKNLMLWVQEEISTKEIAAWFGHHSAVSGSMLQFWRSFHHWLWYLLSRGGVVATSRSALSWRTGWGGMYSSIPSKQL